MSPQRTIVCGPSGDGIFRKAPEEEKPNTLPVTLVEGRLQAFTAEFQPAVYEERSGQRYRIAGKERELLQRPDCLNSGARADSLCYCTAGMELALPFKTAGLYAKAAGGKGRDRTGRPCAST